MPSADSPAAKPGKPRLVPARPAEADESAAYLPRIPWRFVVIGAMSVVTVPSSAMRGVTSSLAPTSMFST